MSIQWFVSIINTQERIGVIVVGLVDQFGELGWTEKVFGARIPLVGTPADVGLEVPNTRTGSEPASPVPA